MKWMALWGLLMLVAACSPPAVETLKIGVVLPLSGDSAFFGENTRDGLDLALEDINANGGINAKPLELIYEDAACDPKKAVSAVTKLITVNGVDAVIGEVCSGATLAISEITQQNNVILMNPCSGSSSISDAGDLVFRTWIPNDYQAHALAKYALAEGFSRLAIIQVANDYGSNLAKEFINDVAQGGGVVVAHETYAESAVDVRSQIIKISAKKPDALVMISYAVDGARIVSQMNQLDKTIPILATNGVNNPEDFIKPLGSLADGIVISEIRDETSEDFKARYEQRSKKQWSVGMCAAAGYDSLALLAQAIGQVGTDSMQIRDYLDGLEGFAGVGGPITFDAKGDLSGDYGIYEIQGGALKLLT